MRRLTFNYLIFNLSKIYFSNKSNKKQEYNKLIYNTLRNMGGVYIKFLQILSVSPSFMDGWSTPKDYEIFNKVEEEYIDLKRYITNIDKYSYITERPFAAGSFAQVYKGKLISGEEVAIKVLRPSVYNNLKRDLKKLKRILRVANLFLPNVFMDIKKAFEEFSKNCILETDYENEIANTEYFYKYYENNDNIVIPRIYKHLCSKTIIVQEYIDGITLADLISSSNNNKSITEQVKEKTGSCLWQQIITIGGEALKTALTAEFTYGDPHPGNIILLRDNKVALIDFGLIARKPSSQEAFYLWVESYNNLLSGYNNYTDLIKTSFMCFCPDLINAFSKYFGKKDFITEMADILNGDAEGIIKTNDNAYHIANEGHLVKFFFDNLESIKAINVKIDMTNYQLLKAMQAFICSITTIDKSESKNKYSYIMKSSIEYALEYCDRKGVNHDFSTKTRYTKEESYEILLDFLTSIANYDEGLFERLNERMFT